ncbi:sodium:proton antiporter [Halopseudomonas salegens]|uniref:Multisubunit sodium/proton antiporter, MrpC subunit n=1 Tax=Halopseudomonas salegens TaxID=1434072 RepID=A0A1H2G0T6_9GAMM|nr:NADH-quinone oxidoreductase subunit K [Halopseudomonas salegens]SDU12918.1 multisubunit sodium/proton antiporter, MrpC subunit [Halopseudomonas salegens]
MEWIAAITAGVMAGLGIWMMLDQHLMRVVLGIAVLGNAINMGVLTSGRFSGEGAAFTFLLGEQVDAANPLPQALVLTAIVIGFALFVFALAVLKRTHELHGDKDTDNVSSVTEQPAPDDCEDSSPAEDRR